ncbi:hypothetical protein [Streptomyces sp. NPDC006140]|uniref:hypothetical protein n=1 Tax=Streptomyces sp. NPDC006140 TaxID=3154579 RepID=UPI0033F8B360
MPNHPRTRNSGPAQSLLWLFGAILTIQGFGSAVTEAGWDTSFGVGGLLRAAHVPEWGRLRGRRPPGDGGPPPREEPRRPPHLTGRQYVQGPHLVLGDGAVVRALTATHARHLQRWP